MDIKNKSKTNGNSESLNTGQSEAESAAKIKGDFDMFNNKANLKNDINNQKNDKNGEKARYETKTQDSNTQEKSGQNKPGQEKSGQNTSAQEKSGQNITGQDKPDQDKPGRDTEYESICEKLDEKTKQCEEYFNKLQRSAAEFDNYRKRSQREREVLCTDVTGDVIAKFLPVVDNLERALTAFDGSEAAKSFKEGVELVLRQFRDVLKNLEVEEIDAIGKKFDPNLHEAVMHAEDESKGSAEIVEEFQKGYKLKEKVIRHSMVKVVN